MKAPIERHESFVDVLIPKSRYSVTEYMICGVYFLFQGETLQYIGQSVNILARCGDHFRQGKPFDSFTFVRCKPEQLDVLERSCIRMFKPPLNGSRLYGDAGCDYDFGNGLGNGIRKPRVVERHYTLVKEPSALLDKKEVAAMIGITTRALSNLLRDGHLNLQPVQIGNMQKYRRSDVESAIAAVIASDQVSGSNAA